MRIARFGDGWGGAYEFGLALMVDSWQSARPPKAAPVGGADGVFDFYGSDNFPVSPVTTTKKFAITAASSAAIEDALMLLRAATIAAGRSKLWWVDRDGVTTFWQWAKCTKLKTADSYANKGRWLMPVEATFYCSEGVWYSATQQQWSDAIVVPTSTVGTTVTGLTNAGNVAALLDVRICPDDSLTVNDCAVGVLGASQWEYGGDFADDLQLSVLASEYKCVETDVIEQQNTIAITDGYGVWGDGRFVYVADGTSGIRSFSVSGAGAFTLLDTDDQGDEAKGVFGDGRFVYLANGTGGIHSYEVDGSGTFTHKDSDDQGGEATGVWCDGKFVFVANQTGGIHSYSVDASGTFTHIDSDATTTDANNVIGDGKFLYVSDSDESVLSYSVDSSGNLTYIDKSTAGLTGRGIWCDGEFVYLGSSFTVYVFSVSDTGVFSLVDSVFVGTFTDNIWGDGDLIYAPGRASGSPSGNVDVLNVNATGGIEVLASTPTTAQARMGVWGDGTFLYSTDDTYLRSYTVNAETDGYSDLDVGEGDLLNRADVDQVAWLWLPPGTHQTNVVVDCSAGGSAQEVDVYLTWWNTHVF